jgi:hypothetical protein
MVDLINSNDGKECMITVFGEEAIALLEFVKSYRINYKLTCKDRNSLMFETLIQQALNWEGGVVFIPLAFGLAVGLGYVIISAARHKKGT